MAFLVAANQFRGLLGERGLLPIPDHLRRVDFRRAPSLFHLRYSDRLFAAVAWTGVVLALVMLSGLCDGSTLASMVVWALLWVLYLSIVNVGQLWYGFGWESLLLETGFLAIFIGPVDLASPVLVLWLLRWLVFRVEFGAGLIKLRGDPCWRDLTCLRYHHETQPMPGPLSWWFHRLPMPLHRVEVAANHVAQLVVPFGLFLPQPVAGISAAVIVVTQSWLVLSGNFAWLNALTIVLAIPAMDDALLVDLLPIAAPDAVEPAAPVLLALTIGLLLLVGALSVRPVQNLLSSRQLMNSSFDPLHLVNTYGAFGSITRVRREVIVEGTDDDRLGPATVWREYEFKGKPGDPRRRPRQFAPYHLRLDWLLWFVGISPRYAERWFGRFVAGLLANDADLLRLLRRNPFPDAPPTFVRARMYEYRYTTWRQRRATGAWWERRLVGELWPETSRQSLRQSQLYDLA